MSHFSVLVVGDVERQLAPFDENDRSILTPVDEAKLDEDFVKYGEEGQPLEAYAYSEGYRLKDGKWCSTYNPRSKWDWYVIGGRWPNQLITKDGTPCNSAHVGDLDVTAMQRAATANHEKWWDETPAAARSWQLGVEPGTTRDEYVARASIASFAVVKGGEWFERGKMGWWACVSNEKPLDQWNAEFAKLLAELPPDARVTVVDCHI